MVYNLGVNIRVKNKAGIKTGNRKAKNDFDFVLLGGKDPDLIESLRAVDVNSPDAKLNEASIGDSCGGKIELNEDEEKVTNYRLEEPFATLLKMKGFPQSGDGGNRTLVRKYFLQNFYKPS